MDEKKTKSEWECNTLRSHPAPPPPFVSRRIHPSTSDHASAFETRHAHTAVVELFHETVCLSRHFRHPSACVS